MRLGHTDRITEKKRDRRTKNTGDTGLMRGNRKDRNCKLKHVTLGYSK